jgi:DNA-binding NtrC family response regulator
MDALLIDDNTLYHALMVETLQPEGIDVYMVSDATSAREILGHMALRLVLWDPYVRGINAVALVAKLHERHPLLPIITVSRYSPSSLIQQEILTYGSHCLVKPFTKEALVQVCRTAVGLNKLSAAGT